MGDAMRDLANQVGLVLVPHSWTSTERTKRYLTLRTMFEIGEVQLPPDQTVRQDLQRVVRRYSSSGISIDLIRTNDGRHADYAPAICMALTRWHEQNASENQRQFEEGYQGFTEDEKKIWGRIENNIKRKNKRSLKFSH